MLNIIKETIDVLTSFHPVKKFHNLFILDKISEKKNENVRKAYGIEIGSDEEILIIYDDTVFGKADNGFAITEKAIYYNLSDPKGGFKRKQGKISMDFILDPDLVGLSVETESEKSGSPKYLIFDGLRFGKFILMDKIEITFLNEFFSALEGMKQPANKKKSTKKTTKSKPDNEFIYFDNGDQYYGSVKDGVRHGQGIYIFSDGRKCVAEWVDGKKRGSGIFTWPNGDKYEGAFREDVRNGIGIFIEKDGSMYEGNWINDKKSGKGIFTWPDGSKYEGNWLDDKRTGEGVYQWPNGDKYEGDFVDQKMHGKGRFNWSNGEEYNGGWVNNNQHGEGIIKYSNGEKYEGDWLKGKRTGYGILYDKKGAIIFQGQWNEGVFVGAHEGTLSEESGTYTGQIDNQKKHGNGVINYSKRKDRLIKFEGEWKNDKTIKGTYFFEGGETITGTFSGDYTSGKGKITQNDGVTFEGIWDDLQLPTVESKDVSFFRIPYIQKILFAKEFIKDDFRGKFIFETQQIDDTLIVESIDDELDILLKDERCDQALKIIEEVRNKITHQEEIDDKIHAHLTMREDAVIKLKNEILHRDIMAKFGVSSNPEPEINQEEKPKDDFDDFA